MKQFFRNFSRQKTVGILNICGLSLAIMVALTVGLWAINEMSFDNFHHNGDRMYRLTQSFDLNDKPVKMASAFKPLGELAQQQIPEIEDMCRVIINHSADLTVNNTVNFGSETLVTDRNFFRFFTFPLKDGDINTAFSGPDNVIITESAAKKYFPDKEAIGQKIIYHGWNFSVSAVMYDFPRNSHIQAEFVFPLFSFYETWQWESSFSYDTYFIIPENADISSIEKRLVKINETGMTALLQGGYHEIILEPLKEVHFSKTDPGFDNAVKGDKSLLMIFIVIAVTILIIACINFTNLFISTSFIRAKTIGIKKTMGADKKQLIKDFYEETVVYVLLAVIGGVLLTLLILPVFNEFVRSNITVDFSSWRLYAFLGGLALVTVIMAGSFPAIEMTRFGVIETLRGKFRGKRMSLFQKVLIIIQFTSSISLLIVVLFFAKQIDHILSQDLKFDNKNVLYMNGWGDFGRNFKELREEMMKDPSIKDVAMRQYELPLWMGNGIGGKNLDTGDMILMDLSEVSPNYFDFFGMQFVRGENPLYLESASTANYCVLNERAVELLGLKEPVIDESFILLSIGGTLEHNDNQPYIVKGVIRNTYVKSLYQNTDPEMYLNLSRDDHNPIFFKVAGDPQRAIKVIEKKWKEMLPNAPFVYNFLDKTYEAQYVTEMNSRKVLSYALFITILITIIGLYAMVFYATQRRIKEIGIRKINGATIKDMLLLLNKDIVIWVIISFIIACPISYYFVDNWLDKFVVRTSISPWIFLGAGLMSFLIALSTVSFQTWKAANMNPADAIQNE